MKIEKLPSGSYRIRKRIDGQDVQMTLSYRPSQKEADRLLRDKAFGKDKLRLTFKQAADKYIDGKKPTLSPSTIKGYKSVLKNLPDWFTDSRIGDISAWDIQKMVGEISKGRSPKTVRNFYGFVCSVFNVFRPQLRISSTLPQMTKKDPYLPSDEDIKAVLDYYKGTEYEIPLRLAGYGLRRSEICAITSDDLNGETLSIGKAKVTSTDGWVIKLPKTPESTRKIVIDKELADLIRASGTAFTGNPNMIYNKLKEAQEELKLPDFPLHAFRHYYASTLHSMGISDAAIMKNGGWKTDFVMKRNYIQAVQKEADDAQKKYIDKLLGKSEKEAKIS